MKKFIYIFLVLVSLNLQARLRNCNNCSTGCSSNQTCCFVVNCPEQCNPYTCSPYCSSGVDPKCVYDPCSGRYLCICN